VKAPSLDKRGRGKGKKITPREEEGKRNLLKKKTRQTFCIEENRKRRAEKGAATHEGS